MTPQTRQIPSVQKNTPARRRRTRWIVTVNGLPSIREWHYFPLLRKGFRLQIPCSLPPADPTFWTCKHGAVRAMRRTIRFNRIVMEKLALCGDWLIRKVPGIALFARALYVDVRRVELVHTDAGWLCEENFSHTRRHSIAARGEQTNGKARA
jgi:hypothetical protein